MSFKNYDATLGVYNSTDVGIYWFQSLLTGSNAADFWKAFRNTFVLSFYGLCFGFPIPIIIALLFSEIKAVWYRATLQILSYLPHFVSVVVVTSIVTMLLRKSVISDSGVQLLGAGPVAAVFENVFHFDKDMIHDPSCFRAVYQLSGIWSDAGYGSIVYFAAVLGISPTNYEAARIDGATKMQQVKYVTIPGMTSTLVIMLILRIGSLFSIGYEKVILLNPEGKNSAQGLYETAQIISTYIYYNSMAGSSLEKSAAAAADLFNSLLAMFLVIGSNQIARKVSKACGANCRICFLLSYL
jgi:putative aldouronate transport system permease protein